MTPRRIALIAILIVAATLRFWGIGLVLPNVDGRPDEREMLAYTSGFPNGDLNPRWFVYPNLFMYLYWVWIEAMLAIRRLWAETPGYAEALRTALPTVLLSGRLLSAAAGTITVLLLARVAARGRGAMRGLVAAALLATCWLHVRDSHFVKTEALLALAVLAATALLARWAESGRRAHAIAAGLAIGVAMGIKYPAVFLLGAAYVAQWLRPGRPRGAAALLPSPDLLLLGVATTVGFVAACPYLVLDFGRTRETAEFLGLALYATRPGTATAGDAVGALGAWVQSRAFGYHVTTSLRYGCGLVATLALPVALVWACRRREPLLVVSATFCVIFFLVAGASPVRLARYLTPITPLIALLLAEGVVALNERAGRWRVALAIALTALLAAEPLRASVQADRIAARDDTRVLATAWMRERLPPGARVAVLGSYLLPLGAPPLPPGATLAPVPPTREAYAARGVTHLVTHEHPLQFSRVDPAVVAALGPVLHQIADFSPFAAGPTGGYEDEDAYYIPFFGFSGVTRPGPHVRIYEVRPGAS